MNLLSNMVEFLGKACGENCEVVLHDLREDKNCIVAIANGNISGRTVGAPPTDLALHFMTQETWKTKDYVCGYEGKTMDNRILQSSTFFIKNGKKLLGMLCINIDAGKYLQLSEAVLRLVGLHFHRAVQIPAPAENFYENMEEIIKSVLDEMGVEEGGAGRFSLEKKLDIIERLMEHGVFLLRGSVSSVAEKLNCSEASMYRYIAIINKRKKHLGK